MKRFGRWLVVLCLLLALAGCSQAEKEQKQFSDSNTEQTAEMTDDSDVQEITQPAGDDTLQLSTESADDSGMEEDDSSTVLPKMQVHYIDVGQGDATLIETDGHAMLIDAGNNSKGTFVQSYLLSKGIKSLDYVIGTHPDADHVGGLDVIIYKFDCQNVLLPDITADTRTWEDVELSMKEKELQPFYPAVGDTFSLGGASFTVISPNRAYGDETNDWSVGILLTHGKNRFLFTGDAGEKAEQDMIKSGISLQADVYKASHHGSKTASSEAFLDAVSPKYGVISCGEDNDYGHPSARTLNSFRQRGMKVFRTDKQGTIVAESDGTDIRWNMSPDESWESGEAKGSSDSTQSYKKTKPAADSTTEGKISGEKITYILNNNTMKYHRTDCARAKDILEKNRENTTLSKKKLEAAGYEPCGFCKP